MGLLDSSDDQIKETPAYKRAVEAVDLLGTEVADFKKEGGAESRLQYLSDAILRLFRACDKGAAEHPNLKEWQSMRDEGMDVAKAACEKFPGHAKLGKLQQFVDDPDKRHP